MFFVFFLVIIVDALAMLLLSMCHSGKTILRLFLCCIFQSRVLSSSSPFITSISPDRVLSLDLNSLLSVLSQAESALQSQHEELKVGHIAPTILDNRSFNHTRVSVSLFVSQGAGLSVSRLTNEAASLQQQLKCLEEENRQLHTQHARMELTKSYDSASR